jgi:hypothetical protein
VTVTVSFNAVDESVTGIIVIRESSAPSLAAEEAFVGAGVCTGVGLGFVFVFDLVIVIKSVDCGRIVVVIVCGSDGAGSTAGGEGAGVGSDGDGTSVLLSVAVPKTTVVLPPVGSGFTTDDGAAVLICPPGPPFPARILPAAALFVHPTSTPRVLFIGMAKHSVPLEQMDITKLPSLLQFPTFPAIQAICPDVHGDEKFMPENSVLYSCASARLELYWAGVRDVYVARLAGSTVGIFVTETGGAVMALLAADVGLKLVIVETSI